MSIFFIAEVGINHNGNLEIAKQLINAAHIAGANAVKFQKRTIDLVYSKEVLDSPRESPWGTTQRAQKEGLELGLAEYQEIDSYCKKIEIDWFASSWDIESQKFLRQFNLKYNKVASAMLTNAPLLNVIAEEKRYTFISTGMHTLEEIGKAIDIFKKAGCEYELMHCNSTYPMPNEEANLAVIETLRNHFGCKIGFSSHEVGIALSVAVVGMGVTSIERHITLDRAMYGSDQAASLEVDGLIRLIRMIRTIEKAMGNGKKVITEKEKSIRKKLAPINVLDGIKNIYQ